jgi:hypothetical protein
MIVKVYAHLADGIRSQKALEIPDLYSNSPAIDI